MSARYRFTNQMLFPADTPTFNQILVSSAPSDDSHVTTKSYVDTQFATHYWKDACQAATTAALAANTYDNGTSGVGATLTGNANGSINPIDGVTLGVNDRLLVKNEVAGVNNGIYVVTSTGDGANPYVLTRATDFDNSPSGEVAGGMSTSVISGTVNANAHYATSNTTAITIGTTAITWVAIVSSVTAGTGISVVGSTVSVDQSFSPSWTGSHDYSGGTLITDYVHGKTGGSLTIATDEAGRLIQFPLGATSGLFVYNSLLDGTDTWLSIQENGAKSSVILLDTKNGPLTIESGTGTFNISDDAFATTLNVGTGNAVKTLTLGSTTGASVSTLQSGTGGIEIQSTGAGTLAMNDNTQTGAITLGNTNTSSTTIKGTNLTANTTSIVLGSATTTSITSGSNTGCTMTLGNSTGLMTFNGLPRIVLPSGMYYEGSYTSGANLTTPAAMLASLTERYDPSNYWSYNSGTGVLTYIGTSSRYFQITVSYTLKTATGATPSTLTLQLEQDPNTTTYANVNGGTAQRYLSGSNDTGCCSFTAWVNAGFAYKYRVLITSTSDTPTYNFPYISFSFVQCL